MPIKVYHPAHGFVLTNDQAEANSLVANGGKIVTKNREVFENEPRKMELEDAVLDSRNEVEEVEEAITKTEILTRPILHRKGR